MSPDAAPDLVPLLCVIAAIFLRGELGCGAVQCGAG